MGFVGWLDGGFDGREVGCCVGVIVVGLGVGFFVGFTVFVAVDIVKKAQKRSRKIIFMVKWIDCNIFIMIGLIFDNKCFVAYARLVGTVFVNPTLRLY